MSSQALRLLIVRKRGIQTLTNDTLNVNGNHYPLMVLIPGC